jgi:hypothetical protein
MQPNNHLLILPTVILHPFHYKEGEAIGFDLHLNSALENEIRS